VARFYRSQHLARSDGLACFAYSLLPLHCLLRTQRTDLILDLDAIEYPYRQKYRQVSTLLKGLAYSASRSIHGLGSNGLRRAGAGRGLLKIGLGCSLEVQDGTGSTCGDETISIGRTREEVSPARVGDAADRGGGVGGGGGGRVGTGLPLPKTVRQCRINRLAAVSR
jgi:hypothetical protein